MLFCESCGSLKRAQRRAEETVHICPKCEPGLVVPVATPSPHRRTAPRHERTGAYETRFQRADALYERETPRPKHFQMERTSAGERPPEPVAPAAAIRGDEPAPKGAGRFFPFTETRPGQTEFIDDVRQGLGDGKVIVAQVPTGLGKTAGVLAPALEIAKETKARIFFLTPKQSQHRVVIETLKLAEKAAGEQLVVSDMIAKKAMCPQPESEMLGARAFGEFCAKGMAKGTCSYYVDKEEEGEVFQTLGQRIHHVERAVEVCTGKHVCPFKALTEVARVADVVVMDYNHFFSDLLPTTLERMRISLENAILVVDEAHNLPERIRDHLSKSLTLNLVSEAIHEAKRVGLPPLSRLFESLEVHLMRLEQEGREVKLEPEELLGPLDEMLTRAFPLAEPGLRGLIDTLHEVAEKTLKNESFSPCGEIALFLETWPPSSKVDEGAVLRMWSPDDQGIVYKVLDAAVLARPIFEEVRGAVLMSGTLFPMEMYGAILGVPADRAMYKLYPNPFPRENRRVAIDAQLSTALKERGPDTFHAFAQRLAQTCEATPGNVAAFFPSYDFLDRTLQRLPDVGRDLVIEERGGDKAAKEALVDRVRDADGRALLLGVQGGSLSEGYDFVAGEDNLLSAVLVVGIPYAVPTLEVKSLQAFYDTRFGAGKGWLYGYLAPALQRVLQAAGRGVRAPHHRAFIGLLDRRFTQRTVQQWLPPDVQPMVAVSVGEECARFFGPV